MLRSGGRRRDDRRALKVTTPIGTNAPIMHPTFSISAHNHPSWRVFSLPTPPHPCSAHSSASANAPSGSSLSTLTHRRRTCRDVQRPWAGFRGFGWRSQGSRGRRGVWWDMRRRPCRSRISSTASLLAPTTVYQCPKLRPRLICNRSLRHLRPRHPSLHRLAVKMKRIREGRNRQRHKGDRVTLARL